MEVVEFLVMIKRYLMRCRLDHLLCWIHIESIFVSSNVEVFVMKWEIRGILGKLFRSGC